MRILVAMWSPSIWELSIVLLLVLVLFGAGKLPQVFGQMGKAVKNFRDAQKDESDDPVDVTPRKKAISKADADAEPVTEAEEIREKA